MKTLKQVEQLTGIKADNLRQRIARKTLKARKIGNTWTLSDRAVNTLLNDILLKRRAEEWLEDTFGESMKLLDKLVTNLKTSPRKEQ